MSSENLYLAYLKIVILHRCVIVMFSIQENSKKAYQPAHPCSRIRLLITEFLMTSGFAIKWKSQFQNLGVQSFFSFSEILGSLILMRSLVYILKFIYVLHHKPEVFQGVL